jgi:hypothetical protein
MGRTLYIKATVTRCDSKEQILRTPEEGVQMISEMKDGSWKATHEFGADHVKQYKIVGMTKEKAVQEVESKGGYLQL